MPDTTAIGPYYSSQEVKGESAAITDNDTIYAALSHRPVLAGTIVVEVFAEEADVSARMPCLRVSFDSAGAADTTEVTGDLVVNTAPGATTFNHVADTIQVKLSSGHFPSGAVARVNYEYDTAGLDNNPKDAVTIEKTQTTSDITTIAIDVLNRAYNADPEAVHAMLCNRVPCNEYLADDPTIVVDGNTTLGKGYTISMLGVINGILGQIGTELIAAQFTQEEQPRFLGFCKYSSES